jgi:hypothetical protein
MEVPSTRMTIPYYIGEAESDMRGIKSGWYAMGHDGNLLSRPFPGPPTCAERDIQPAEGSPPAGCFDGPSTNRSTRSRFASGVAPRCLTGITLKG